MQYNVEDLQKYRKADLINVIMSICDQFNHHKRIHEEYKEQVRIQVEKNLEAIKAARDEGYKEFCNGNGKYLERFITEFLKKNLEVELREVSGGGAYTVVNINDQEGRHSGITYICECR